MILLHTNYRVPDQAFRTHFEFRTTGSLVEFLVKHNHALDQKDIWGVMEVGNSVADSEPVVTSGWFKRFLHGMMDRYWLKSETHNQKTYFRFIKKLRGGEVNE